MPEIIKVDGRNLPSSRIMIQAATRMRIEKRCIMCGETKGAAEFYQTRYTTNQGKQSVRLEPRCKPCARARRRAAHHADPERAATSSRAYRKQRPGYTADMARAYRATDAGKRAKAKGQRLRKARMRSGQGDNAAIRSIYAQAIAEEVIIACCPVFDLPELGKKLHVDHRIPLSKGGPHHEGNLQILPIGLNMRKGSKCPR